MGLKWMCQSKIVVNFRHYACANMSSCYYTRTVLRFPGLAYVVSLGLLMHEHTMPIVLPRTQLEEGSSVDHGDHGDRCDNAYVSQHGP